MVDLMEESVDMSTKEAQKTAFDNNIAPCNIILLINQMLKDIEDLKTAVF
jgi:hypothetical protein